MNEFILWMWNVVFNMCFLHFILNLWHCMFTIQCPGWTVLVAHGLWYYFFPLAFINATFLVQIFTLFVFVFIQCFNSCKGRLLSGYIWARLQFSAFCYMVHAKDIWDFQICTLELSLELKIAPVCPQRHTMSALMTSESWSKRNTHEDQLIRLAEANQPTEILSTTRRRWFTINFYARPSCLKIGYCVSITNSSSLYTLSKSSIPG